MKRSIYIGVFSLFSLGKFNAQVNVATNPSTSIVGENAFLDASSFSDATLYGDSKARGLIFPQVDLTQFKLKPDNVNEYLFPTAYDGMIVYNIKGGTTSDPLFTGNQIEVEPGFYYFHNPQGKNLVAAATNATDIENAVKAGKWVPLGSGGSATIKTTETRLGKVGTDQLYGIKGSFTVNATDGAKVVINFPSGLSSIYSIKIYDSATKKLVASSLSSYDVANNKAVTGMGNMSIPLPVATYDYILEYFK